MFPGTKVGAGLDGPRSDGHAIIGHPDCRIQHLAWLRVAEQGFQEGKPHSVVGEVSKTRRNQVESEDGS
jgi:hypothetical protein